MSDNTNFSEQDFARSGINKDVYVNYYSQNYIEEEQDGYKIIYPELYKNIPTEYFNKRLKECSDGNKYIKPQGLSSRLFRPINLDLNSLNDDWLIITEGEKKAIKAVQEGFKCIAISGVWCWKQSPENSEDDCEAEDIIPDVQNLNVSKIVLCFDSDMWEKEEVKRALYSFALYLLAERNIRVKILILPHGNAKGLDDYLIAHGNVAFQELLDNAKEYTIKDIQEILSGKNSKTLEFPIEVFNQDIQDFLVNTANKMDAPLEYLAVAFLVGASALMNGYYKIIVNSDTNWFEYPILWGAIVGGPSQKKTPCISIIRAIIADFEIGLQNEYELKNKQYRKDLELYKIQKEQAKKSKQPTANFLIEEPEKPYPTVITVQDTTKEALSVLVKNNGVRGVSIFVDELASFLKSLGQYKNGNGSDEEYFLQAWQKQICRITRKSTEENFIISPSHNILGTIQPKVLDKTLFKEGFDTTNGMIERWLFVCTNYEETGILYRTGNKLNTDIIRKIYEKLYSLEFEQVYYFSDNAKVIFDEYIKYIAKTKKRLDLTDLMKNYLQKQTNYVARFSLILHCINDNFETYSISSTTVQNAIKLSQYFIRSFESVANVSVNNDGNGLTNFALNYIKTKNLKTISPSQLHRSNTSRYRCIEQARQVLSNLANSGYGRLCKGKKKGQTFIFYK